MNKSPKETEIQAHHIVLPSHTNALGTIFGGVLMSWIDIAAAICAQKYSRHVCVTASVDALHFLAPARLGDQVNLTARVVFTGRTSMIVLVDAVAENPRTGSRHHCVTASLSFVALNDKGRPTRIPPLSLRNAEDRRMYQMAEKRRNFLLKSLTESRA